VKEEFNGNLSLFVKGYRDKSAWISVPNSVRFLFVRMSVGEVQNTWDDLLACILDPAACKKKNEDQLRWTTRDLQGRIEKCTEGDGGIFQHLLWNVTDLHLNMKLELKNNKQ